MENGVLDLNLKFAFSEEKSHDLDFLAGVVIYLRIAHQYHKSWEECNIEASRKV